MRNILIVAAIAILLYFLLKKFKAKNESGTATLSDEKQQLQSGRGNPNAKTVDEWLLVLKPNWKETGNVYGIPNVENDERAIINTDSEGNDFITIPDAEMNNKEKAQYRLNLKDVKDTRFGRKITKKKTRGK